MNGLILKAIVFYKRKISPRKGYICAYRIFHGGQSCSTIILNSIQARGVIRSISVSLKQFKECSVASKKLSDDSKDHENNPEKDRKDECIKHCALDSGANAACCLFSGLS